MAAMVELLVELHARRVESARGNARRPRNTAIILNMLERPETSAFEPWTAATESPDLTKAQLLGPLDLWADPPLGNTRGKSSKVRVQPR